MHCVNRGCESSLCQRAQIIDMKALYSAGSYIVQFNVLRNNVCAGFVIWAFRSSVSEHCAPLRAWPGKSNQRASAAVVRELRVLLPPIPRTRLRRSSTALLRRWRLDLRVLHKCIEWTICSVSCVWAGPVLPIVMDLNVRSGHSLDEKHLQTSALENCMNENSISLGDSVVCYWFIFQWN